VNRIYHEKGRGQDFTKYSIVTQTMLSGLTIYPRVANFLECMCQKLSKLPGRRQSYYKNNQAYFLAHPVYLANTWGLYDNILYKLMHSACLYTVWVKKHPSRLSSAIASNFWKPSFRNMFQRVF